MSLLIKDETNQIQNMFRRDLSLGVNYDVSESFNQYKKGQAKILKDNLDLLNEIPLNEDFRAELVEFFKRDIIENLDNDPLYEKAIEIKQHASNMSKKLHKYFKEVGKFHLDLKNNMHADLLHLSKLFLNSDLPTSFLNVVSDSLIAGMDYIDVYNREIYKERMGLIVNLSNKRKFDRLCKQHNFWSTKFNQKQDELEKHRLKLVWYVDFNNSTKVEDIFKDKKIRMEKLDRTIFNEFILEVENQINEMEEINLSLMDYSDIVSEFNEPNKTLLELIQTISAQ